MELWFTEEHTKNVRFGVKVDRAIYSAQSEFQRIDIFESPEFGRFLTLDGYIMLTEKDEFIYHEMLVHVPLCAHGSARRVLVIGGGDGGAVRELMRYPSVERVDLVEIDSMVIEAAEKYLPQTASALRDKRVTIHIADGLKFVRQKTDEYDVILVDSTDPFGPGEGLFTREFYGNCKRALKADGILANQHESPFYAADAPTNALPPSSRWLAFMRPTSLPTPAVTGSLASPQTGGGRKMQTRLFGKNWGSPHATTMHSCKEAHLCCHATCANCSMRDFG